MIYFSNGLLYTNLLLKNRNDSYLIRCEIDETYRKCVRNKRTFL